jgi:S-methylmethionine-dependent homocysteine/selenocysteine methylase
MSVVDQLSSRLADGEVIVIDGGMGTELQARGAPMDHEAWCGIANLEQQDLVRGIHEDFIRAGADVIITNTYPTVRFALEAAGYGDRVEEANRRAVEAALQARENAGDRPVAIAGSMSVWGSWDTQKQPDGERRLREGYGEQASILADAGVDLIVLEMFGASWFPGLDAAASTGLPVWIGPMVDLDDSGRPMLHSPGGPDADFDGALPGLIGPGVTAITVMHSEVEPVVPALEVVKRHWQGPFGAYPHVGTFERPQWVFGDVTPDQFAAQARGWVDLGAQLVGGCCGLRPEHIRALRDQLPSHVPEATTR